VCVSVKCKTLTEDSRAIVKTIHKTAFKIFPYIKVAQPVGHGPLVGHGWIFDRQWPSILKLSMFCKLILLIEKVGSSWALNIITRSLSSLRVKIYSDMEISSTQSTTLRTICSYWRYFEADRWLVFRAVKLELMFQASAPCIQNCLGSSS